MHAIRTTPGLIIDSRAYGEAGKMLSIFTRDLGLVTATAQGIRFEKSKLRYHTQDHSLGSFSFVQGKEYWRLTSADALHAPYPLPHSPYSNELIARIALLLRRLLHGEEPHPELFGCVEACARFIGSHADDSALSDDQMRTLESVVVLRILHALGYVGNDAGVAGYSGSAELTVGLLDQAASKRTIINQHINKALRESHL